MISREKIELCAHNIVNCANIKEGECVLINGGLYCQELLEEIAVNVYRKGGLPHVRSTSDDYKKKIAHDSKIKTETLAKPHIHYVKMVENIDVYIVIEPFEDPLIKSQIPKERMNAIQKSRVPSREIIYAMKEEYAPGKKWVYAAWPSEKAANYYKINYKLYEQFIIDGMIIPSSEIIKITKEIKKHFENAKKVYVTDDNGTDFWISVENREAMLDDGTIDDEKIAKGDIGANLPAGEVFFPPVETKGEGRLFSPLTIDRFSGQIIENVDLTFKDGKLLMDKITTESKLDVLLNSFTECEKMDKAHNVPELRTYNVAEFAIGCNPKITKAVGYILTDEKINGSVHVAFGGNNFFGGESVSQMHWDFVTAPIANVIVEYLDGNKKQIMKNGKMIA